MKLTRRDALNALAAGGVATGSGLAVSELLVRTEFSGIDSPLSEGEFETVEAVAETIYPSEIDVIEASLAQLTDERKASTSRSIADLDAFARNRYGQPFRGLSRPARDSALRSLGVNRTESRPDGNRSEQIRYHLVNSLFYLLFSSPKGSRLVGIENPNGHPEGFAVYSRQRNTIPDQ